MVSATKLSATMLSATMLSATMLSVAFYLSLYWVSRRPLNKYQFHYFCLFFACFVYLFGATCLANVTWGFIASIILKGVCSFIQYCYPIAAFVIKLNVDRTILWQIFKLKIWNLFFWQCLIVWTLDCEIRNQLRLQFFAPKCSDYLLWPNYEYSNSFIKKNWSNIWLVWPDF